MIRFARALLGGALLAALTTAACQDDPASATQPRSPVTAETGGSAIEISVARATFTVLAGGLNNPRGLKFGPDGNLYVAEGGTGGTNSTVGQCPQVVPAVGPYTGSTTGSRILRIDANGGITVAADRLPSSQTSAATGNLVSGVADVAFIGNTLYGLETGAGCSHGVAGTSNQVFRVNADRSWTTVADLSAWYRANPTAHMEPDDFEPDGTPYSMIAVRGDLYVVEPNHGSVERVGPDGSISRVVDVSATQGHIVPTSISYHGNFYVGNLNTFPIVPGSSKILKITPSGEVLTWATGLTTVLGTAWDGRGRLYVLESSTAPGNPAPFTGDIRRIDPSGTSSVILDGLFLPSGLTIGPDGNLYVTNVGYGPPPIGLGQILRVVPPRY